MVALKMTMKYRSLVLTSFKRFSSNKPHKGLPTWYTAGDPQLWSDLGLPKLELWLLVPEPPSSSNFLVTRGNDSWEHCFCHHLKF